MIYLDDRVGSKELFSLFPKRSVTLTHLNYADIAFLGRGPDDLPISIGIERKRLNDLVTSMTSGRLSGHQLPGLSAAYDIVYLIVEGIWRPNPRNGILEKPVAKGWAPLRLGSRTFMATEILGFLNTLRICAGVYIWRTAMPRETVQYVNSLHHWWVDKAMDEHRSHTLPHAPYASLSTKRPSIVQRIAAELPGVGFGKSKSVSKRFNTILEMVMASEKDWREVEGIGKTLAKRITKLLQKGIAE